MRRHLLLPAVVALLLAACGSGTDVTVEDDVPVAQATSAEGEDDGSDDGGGGGGGADADADGDDGQDGEDDDAGDDDTDTDDDAEGGTSAQGSDTEDPCADPPEEGSFAGILLSSPTDGATISDGDALVGCGSTFEATFLWEVEYDDGSTDGGFGTMTCGSGCIGTFDHAMELTGSGAATLTVFEESAEDGSRVNEVVREVVVE